MSRFQRVRSFILGILYLVISLLLLLLPKDSYGVITLIISFMLLFYSISQLIYYASMARHMVGGKIILCEAIILLDLGLFIYSLYDDKSLTILIFLLIIYAFSGFVDILRAFEEKKNGSHHWIRKLVIGLAMVIFALALVIIGLIMKNTIILKYGFCLSVAYAGIRKIITAFKHTAIVYIQ